MSEKELVQAEEVVASTVEETAEAPVAEAEVVAAVEAGEAEVVAESVAAEAVVEESAVVAEVKEVAEAVETAEVTEVVEATEVIEAAPVAEAVEIAEVTEVVEAAPVAEVTEAVEAAPVAEGEGDDEDGPVVKLLSVGQPIQGTVKRITEFGAFVDIGVGRDGLVHISELSTTRIAKVNDVLSEGQALTFWIKKLDRDRNRISLTLIEPGQRTIRDLQVGEVVEGTVTRILPYGAFIDIGVGRDALLHVREMAEGFVAKPEDVVKPGEPVEVRIIEVARRRNRIDVSMKGLRPEPEQTASAEAAVEDVIAEEEAEAEDKFADVEALTTMQMAFLKAQERSGVSLPTSKKKSRRNDAAKKRAAQEDIFARTLSAQPGNPPAKK